ncbi:Ribonuclease H-like domain containing protein [Rhypophila sp. PSN 637]
MSYKQGASSYGYQDSGHGFDDIHFQDPPTKTSRLSQFDGHRHHVSGPEFFKDTIALKFPHEPEYVHDNEGPDSLGLTNLEITGLEFRHVRCPRASEPCPGNCSRYGCHVDSLIIACDGACPHNGTPKAVRSSFGVFFGYSDEAQMANWSCLVPGSLGENTSDYPPDNDTSQHTSQRAELWDAIVALESAKPFVENGGQWYCDVEECLKTVGREKVGRNGCKARYIVIKSDSAYLANSITGHVNKWLKNGWLTVKKTPVANQDLWVALVVKIIELSELGASVAFWLVPREENQDADELANDAPEENSE